MAYKKECVLFDRECIECGECELCDLDHNKKCDNCCKCIDIPADYKSIQVDEIIDDEEVVVDDSELEEWKYQQDYIVDYSKEENGVED